MSVYYSKLEKELLAELVKQTHQRLLKKRFIKRPIVEMSFSSLDAQESENDNPVEFGEEDQNLKNVIGEDQLFFLIKTLPNDKYRTIALLLFVTREMGYHITKKKIATIWEMDPGTLTYYLKRLRKVLTKNNNYSIS